jgi:AcrR family transcriptional regulator
MPKYGRLTLYDRREARMSSTETSSQPSRQRAPLTRDRVLQGAVEVADAGGIDALTMRNLAQHLGVEAMSLYYHVENKASLLDGTVEVIIGEIMEAVASLDGPDPDDDWKGALRLRILTARDVLLRHKWAPAVIEQRSTMSPSVIFYYEGILEIMRRGGFSYDLAHHALHALGSRALGFTQELFQPEDASAEDVTEEMFAAMADQLPYLAGMLSEIVHEDPDSTIGWCDDQSEFEFGLDLMLDGLELIRQRD